MRVTFNSGFANALAAINAAAERLLQRQEEVATGKRLHVPSDDPSAMSGAISARNEARVLDQYRRTTDSAESRLLVLDSALTEVIKSLTTAQSHAAAARTTVLTPEQRDALALAIEGTRDAILNSVSTSYNGIFLFSGSASTTEPYSKGPPITAYQGDNLTVSVDATRTREVAVTVDGDAVLRGSDPDDVFVVLTNLATAARTGDMAGIDQGFAALDRAFDRVTTAQSRVGADLSAIESQRRHLDEMRRAADRQRSTLEDANLAESISGLTSAEQAQRAALSALSTANRLSLFDFLR